MNKIEMMVWLFPILFIFHDFEEIIFLKAWLNMHRDYLHEQFPVLAKRLLPHFESITTSSFALGVAEEFILISIITIVAFMTKWYTLWLGLFMAFTLHLVIHCFQALIVKKYIPAVITSIICLPICSYIIQCMIKVLPLSTVICYFVLGLIFMIVNLAILHKCMNRFGKWIVRYEEQANKS